MSEPDLRIAYQEQGCDQRNVLGFSLRRAGRRTAASRLTAETLSLRSSSERCSGEPYPIGTKAYLALVLLRDTGQRRGDVVRMGRQHIRQDLLPKKPHGWLCIVQRKTGTLVEVPVTDALQAAINAAPNKHLTFLTTSQGQPFTDAGFTNWFRDRCNEAGLPKGLSAHGLRKARARRIADKNLSAHAVGAVSGHKTLSEMQRYTVDYSRRKLADEAMRDEISDVPTGEIKKTGA